ncbi:hypothetical protein HYY73_02855 [Candidatus Woesearchaeota archaeon]|nr:hypothetical protein [Candidatus Woesearchaeota archaeon]
MLDGFPIDNRTPPEDSSLASGKAPRPYPPPPPPKLSLPFVKLEKAVSEVYEKYAAIADPSQIHMQPGQGFDGLIRVSYTKLSDSYTVHAFVMGRGVNAQDLKGSPALGQATFPIRSLANFSAMYEELLERIGIAWHRNNPLRPTDSEPYVSYELIRPSNDFGGEATRETVKAATYLLQRKFTSQT